MPHLFRTLSLFAIAFVLPLCANSIEKKDLKRLSVEAKAIAEVVVLDRQAAWDQAGKLIWTHYTLQIRATWKGSLPKTIRLSEPGGIVGAIGQRIAGVPTYEVGEALVIFLTEDALSQWRTVGLIQGAFRIAQRTDGQAGVRFARGLSHVTAAEFQTAGGRPRKGATLEEFRQIVMGLSSAEGSKR